MPGTSVSLKEDIAAMRQHRFVDEPSAIVGFSDVCVQFPGTAGPMIRMAGWARDPNNLLHRPAQSVIVVDEQRNVLAEVKVSLPRPDVASSYHAPELTQCGWNVFLPASILEPGEHRLSGYAVDASTGTAYKLRGDCPVVVERPDPRIQHTNGDAHLSRTRPSSRAENRQLNWQEQVEGRSVLESYPQLVLLELTIKCNLNCVMCFRHNTDLDEHISDEQYERVKTALFPYAQRVVLSSRAGEPTLYPKLSQVVQDIVDSGANGALDSNATVMTLEKARLLVDAGFEVHFSVDGATSRTYQYVRGFPLATVAKNIQEFVRYYRAKKAADTTAPPQNWPKVIVNFTPMMVNVRETPAMVDLIADWGVEALFVQKLALNNGYIGENWRPETDPTALDRLYDEAKQRAESRGVVLVIADKPQHVPPTYVPTSEPAPDRSHLGCTRPFSDAIVNLDGNVYPCCFGAPPMGYLKHQTFDQIWNGKPWVELRKGLAEGNPPDYCRRCHLLGQNQAKETNTTSNTP